MWTDDQVRWLFAFMPISIPGLALVGGLMLYWICRLRGAGRELSRAEMHSIDDGFHASLLVTLALYALLARRVLTGGLVGPVLVVAFFGVRAARGRSLRGWPLTLVAMVFLAVAWRVTHPLIEAPSICTKLIQNVG